MARINLPNVEKSLFKAGEYIGYDGRGYPWRIMRTAHTKWRAVAGASHPCRATAPTLTGATLTDLAARIANRGAAVAAQ